MNDQPWELRTWQQEALEATVTDLEAGKKPIIAAIMGSGKSVVIAELAHYYSNEGLTVIATPTQQLVEQLGDTVGRKCLGKVGLFYQYEKNTRGPIIIACNASAGEIKAQLRQPVNLLITDEAHRTGGPAIQEAYDVLQPKHILGLTATPFRSKEKEKLSLFDTVSYRYSLGDALRDKVVVPWKVISYENKSGDLDPICLDMMIDHAEGPGMVNAMSIDDANTFCVYLNANGVKAEVIHSERKHKDNYRSIELLRVGAIDCIVHVNMLSEGVDLPWLQWLCLRRPVAARVRFIQEAGRVIRAAPGKDHAVFLDPHDLFGTFGWVYEEALGEWEKAKAESRGEIIDERTSALKKYLAQHVDPLTSYARRLLLPLQAYGWAKSESVYGPMWRRSNPTNKALGFLGRLAGENYFSALPQEHQPVVTEMLNHSARLTAGAVGDLIEIALVLKAKHFYPESGDIDLPPEESLENLKHGKIDNIDTKWYVSGVWKKDSSNYALAVMNGGKLIASRVEERDPEETWGSLQMRSAILALEEASKLQLTGEMAICSEDYTLQIALSGSYPSRGYSLYEREVFDQLNKLLELVRNRIVVSKKKLERGKNPSTSYAFRALNRRNNST